MAQHHQERHQADTTDAKPAPTAEQERETIRESNDLDQELERHGVVSRHNRGYDDAAHGTATSRDTSRRRNRNEEREDVDPDSARSEVDRDDMPE
jgi:hypothetical protein